MSSPSLRASRRTTPLVFAAFRRAVPSPMQRRHQSGVHCKLNSVPQSETVNNDLDSALIEAVERPEVQIANKSVNPHATTPADLCGRTLKLPNTPTLEHAARWWPYTSKKAATSAGARGQWEWEKHASTQPHT